MTRFHYRFSFACLMVIGFALVGCSRMDGTSVVSPAESPELTDVPTIGALEPTATERSPTSTSRPVVTTPTIASMELAPTLTGQPVVATSTAVSGGIRLVKVPKRGKGSVTGLHWSENGQSVVYATYFFDEQGEVVKEWWEYEVASGECHSIEPPFDLDSRIWEQLEATRPSAFLPPGTVSPSGMRVIYARISPGYSATPIPDGLDLPPIEIWTARTDGSEAVKIGGPYPGCQTLGRTIWFGQETKVIFVCGYEGPSSIFLANVDGSLFVTLNEVTGVGAGAGFGWMALSPDESKLAFTDFDGTLHIVPLDGSKAQSVRFGLVPNWSPDNRRLYYLQGQDEMFSFVGGIYVYDLDTGMNAKVFSSPAYSSDGTEVSISAGEFAVSPLENAAVFQSRGWWLVTWSP